MLLSALPMGEVKKIKKIAVKEKEFLISIGLAEGVAVEVVAKFNGNMIIGVRNSRIAIAKKLADRIYI